MEEVDIPSVGSKEEKEIAEMTTTAFTSDSEHFFFQTRCGKAVCLDISNEALSRQGTRLGEWVFSIDHSFGLGFVVGVGEKGKVWIQYISEAKRLGRQSIIYIPADFRENNRMGYEILDQKTPFRGYQASGEAQEKGLESFFNISKASFDLSNWSLEDQRSAFLNSDALSTPLRVVRSFPEDREPNNHLETHVVNFLSSIKM